jgi:predicted transcriptional regulator
MKLGEGNDVKTAGNFGIESLDERKIALLDHISNVPGIRYRELLKLSGFSNGVLFYHLTGLEEAGLIRVERKCAKKTTRYYPNNISEVESAILSYLRHKPVREIILFILENRQCNFSDIVNYTGKAISTVSSHLGYLKHEEIISIRRSGQGFLYSLANPELVADVASKYKMRLIDKSINNFLDMVEEL